MTPTGVKVPNKIGVLLVEGQHGVLSDMVRDVLQHAPRIALVGDVTEIADTMDAVARTGCDAVVWVVPHAHDAVAPPDLLRRHPKLRIVAVEARGREGSLWRMRPHRTRLDRLSPDGIVQELLRDP
jgi:hypothetical protein